MSFSLSDLIYGSQSQVSALSQSQDTYISAASNANDSSNGKRAKRTSQSRDSDVDKYYDDAASKTQKKKIKYDYEENNEDREFFGVNAPQTTHTKSRRLRAKSKTVFDNYSGEFVKINDETEEEREERLEKMKEKRRLYMRRRRMPRWNFQNEVDVGNAVKYTVQKAVTEEKKIIGNTRKRTREMAFKEDEDEEVSIASQSQCSSEQSPSQSQDTQLGSLITRTKEINKPALIYEDPREDPSHPQHYVWLGYCAPKRKDMKYYYKSLLRQMLPKIGKNRHVRETDDNAAFRILVNKFTSREYFQENGKGKTPISKIAAVNDNKCHGSKDESYAPLLDFGYSSHDRNECTSKDYMRIRYLINHKGTIQYDKEHDESKKIQSIVARYLVGCAGVLPNVPKEILEQMLDLLHDRVHNADEIKTVLRQSQSIASNWVLWKEMEPIITKLRDGKFLSDESYCSIREELLSAESSEFFNDPWLTTNTYSYVTIGTYKRRSIFKFLNKLRMKHLSEEGLEKVFKDENVSEADAHGDNSTHAEDGITSGDENNLLKSWRLKYAQKQAEKIPLNRMKHTTLGEKYTQVVHQTPTSTSTIHLTASFLFSIMSRQRAQSKIDPLNAKSPLWKVHQEIEQYFSRLSSFVWNMGVENPSMYHKTHLSAPLAHVELLRQSYIANSGMVGMKNKIKKELDYDSESTASLNSSNENATGADYKEIAGELSAQGQLHLRDNKLRVFHQIHLTTGVAILAKCFRSFGAEILSRPCFSGDINEKTPFDLLRLALEAADMRGDIQRDSMEISYGSTITEADELIREFEVSADIFHDLLIFAPDNLDCYCWYVAARIGCMLVGSGIDIGKGARAACPHDYSMDDLNLDGAMGRSRHSRYNSLRASASIALRQFLALHKTSKQIGLRYHRAIKSLLEWKEAICLLSFRPHVNNHVFPTIRQLHASHSIACANYDCTEESLASLANQSESGLISQNTLMSMLSNLIEVDPNKSKHWFALASALVLLKEDKSSLAEQRLRSSWWASHVVQYWESQYFLFPIHLIPDTSYPSKDVLESFKFAREAIVDSLENRNEAKTAPGSHLLWSNLKRKVKLNMKGKDWLWPTAESDADEEDHLDLINDDNGQETMKLFNGELPGAYRSDAVNLPLYDRFFDQMDHVSAVIACKTIISCHMYGSNNFAKEAVRYLVGKCISFGDGPKQCTIDKHCDEYRLLLWLAKSKIDVLQNIDRIILDLSIDCEEKELEEEHYFYNFVTF